MTMFVLQNPLLDPSVRFEPGVKYIDRMISTFITLAFIAGSIVFFFMFVKGAIGWISSSGDKMKLESAQKTITHAIIGVIALFSVYAIISLVETLFGIDILVLDIGALRIQ